LPFDWKIEYLKVPSSQTLKKGWLGPRSDDFGLGFDIVYV
jgi:hypothetical protein